jgi:hypothetical protein
MPSKTGRLAVVLLTLSFVCACSRPPAASDDNASNSGTQKLPFDRQPRSTGVSPSQALVPSVTKLPEGTPIPIRLGSTLSSARSRAGDAFSATLDEPVVLDGQTLIESGTAATGRVLEAKPSVGSLEPGYLRIVLVSLNVGGRRVMIETSSIFAKGGSREERKPAADVASGARQKDREKDKDIVLATDRRLNFRLAQTIDLQ